VNSIWIGFEPLPGRLWLLFFRRIVLISDISIVNPPATVSRWVV
jgi:hypothetical protein